MSMSTAKAYMISKLRKNKIGFTFESISSDQTNEVNTTNIISIA